MMQRCPAAFAACCVFCAGVAIADDGFSLWSTTGASLLQPEAEAPTEIPLEEQPPTHERFGLYGQEWVSITAGYGSNFDDTDDYNIAASYSLFLDDDFEWLLEGGAWYYDQDSNDAYALNLSTMFRYHLINEDSWSFFADLGIGVQFATDAVPEDAKEFGFTPRIGVGATARLDGATRLVGGVRWHHVSNGHLWGDDDNDPHDGLVGYVGVMFRLP